VRNSSLEGYHSTLLTARLQTSHTQLRKSHSQLEVDFKECQEKLGSHQGYTQALQSRVVEEVAELNKILQSFLHINPEAESSWNTSISHSTTILPTIVQHFSLRLQVWFSYKICLLSVSNTETFLKTESLSSLTYSDSDNNLPNDLRIIRRSWALSSAITKSLQLLERHDITRGKKLVLSDVMSALQQMTFFWEEAGVWIQMLLGTTSSHIFVAHMPEFSSWL
jgi:hypothetical protein